jgi:formylglycine-generating enzyme required for sulfatase activity/serine/threonine protein kinase
MQPQPSFVPIGTGYKLIARIGIGAFAEVWRAQGPGGVEVAVKIFSRPSDEQEAQKELRALELIKQLRHPYLLQTHAYWEHENKLYIAMELAEGSLRDRLRDCQKQGMPGIPPRELLTYMLEAAEALDYLHSEKVHHRDIKPENILVLKRHAKVADFGLARLKETMGLGSYTNSGTPHYMAPEMWGSKVSEHTDQYCLAVTYAELRLARRLFGGTDLIALMRQHLTETPDLQPLAESEQQVLLRALAKQPTARFGNCLAFAQALADCFPSQVPAKTPVPVVADSWSAHLGSGSSVSVGPLDSAKLNQFDSVKGSETPKDSASLPTDRPAAPKPAATPRPGAWQDQRPRQRSRFFLGVLSTLVVVAGLAFVLWACGVIAPVLQEDAAPLAKDRSISRDQGIQGKGSFILVPPARISLETGEEKRAPIQVRRTHLAGPVEVSCSKMPPGITFTPVTLGAGKEAADMVVRASGDASVGRHKLKLQAICGNARAEADFELVVSKAKLVAKRSFILVPPATISLETGQQKSAPIKVRRMNLDGPVQVTFSDVPAGVVLEPITIPAGKDDAALVVKAIENGDVGRHRIKVVAVCGNARVEVDFELEVRKSLAAVKPSFVLVEPPRISLNTGESKSVPIRVRRTNLEGSVRVTFSDLPAGILINPVTIPAGADSVQTLIQAKWGAALGNHQVKMVGLCKDNQAAGVLQVVVNLPPVLRNSIGMRLELVSQGKFFMGSPADENGRVAREGPRHEVEISRPFYLGQFTVTRGQFRKFVEETGYQTAAEKDGKGTSGFDPETRWFVRKAEYNWRNPGFGQTDQHPVVNVSWNDARAFCQWLSRQDGKPYRLPTEAEWEYGCRAGTTTRFYSGENDSDLQSVANVADASLKTKLDSAKTRNWMFLAWDDTFPFTAPVGQFKPNRWALYDMHGNVWQWCADWYDEEYYAHSPSKDPKGPPRGKYRLLRGGSWRQPGRFCRAAYRWYAAPANRFNHVGFRVVCGISP